MCIAPFRSTIYILTFYDLVTLGDLGLARSLVATRTAGRWSSIPNRTGVLPFIICRPSSIFLSGACIVVYHVLADRPLYSDGVGVLLCIFPCILSSIL